MKAKKDTDFSYMDKKKLFGYKQDGTPYLVTKVVDAIIAYLPVIAVVIVVIIWAKMNNRIKDAAYEGMIDEKAQRIVETFEYYEYYFTVVNLSLLVVLTIPGTIGLRSSFKYAPSRLIANGFVALGNLISIPFRNKAKEMDNLEDKIED